MLATAATVLTASPEATVAGVYALAATMVYYGWMAGLDDVPIPLVSQLNLAGVLIVGSSFWYHFVTVSASNGIEAVFLLITQYTGVVLAVAMVFGPFRKKLT